MLTEEQKAEVYAFAKEGITVSRIARKFGCSKKDVQDVLNNLPEEHKKEGSEQEILQEYEKGTNLSDLCEIFQKKRTTLKNLLIRKGVYRKEDERVQQKLTPEQEQRFLEAYANGKAINQIALDLDCYASTLRTFLHKQPFYQEKQKADSASIVQKYQQGMTTRQLARVHKKQEPSIIRILKLANVYQEPKNDYSDHRIYEIECESEEEAKNLSNTIRKALSLHPYQKQMEIHFQQLGSTLLLEGKILKDFHQFLLKHYIDIEDEKNEKKD